MCLLSLCHYSNTNKHMARLLVRVLQGESVVLSGLDDADLRAGLEGVLAALGLQLRKPSEAGAGAEEGYALPPARAERLEAARRMGGLLRRFAKRGTVPAEVGGGGWGIVGVGGGDGCGGVLGWVWFR